MGKIYFCEQPMIREGNQNFGFRCPAFKVPLTPPPPQIFPLLKSTSFPDYFSEKNISIDKILAFLQAFEHLISMFMTAQDLGCHFGNRAETLRRLSGLSFMIHILSELDKIFE